MKRYKKLPGRGGRMYTAAERMETFFMRIEKMPNGCWEWRGATARGYGKVSQKDISPSPRSAHRVAWEMFRGPIPPNTMVLHRCDVRCCCNPDHLFLGDTKDNALDAVSKDRWGDHKPRRGEDNNKAKLTVDDVTRMRYLHAQGQSYAALGRMFGVSEVQAANIVKRLHWKHIP